MTAALAGLLEEALASYPHEIESTDGTAAPADVVAAARRLAETLRDRGLSPNEPVLVQVANRPGDIAAFLGVWQAGGVAVPLHALAAPSTVEAVQAQSAARFCVECETLTQIASLAPPARPLLEGAALVIFTSGSTGTPKGVVIGHDAFAGKLDVLDRMLRLRPDDTVQLPLQLIFIFGLWALLLALRSKARLILVGKFTADTVIGLMPRTTVFVGVPSMMRAIFARPAVAADGLRIVLTGGEALGLPLSEALSAAYPRAGVFDLYGLTETGSCDFCLAPRDALTGAGTIGRPTENVDIRLGACAQAVDEGCGELLIRTPYGMLGYLDNAQLTAAAFEDGFFRTGDLARVRPDGLVAIVGRLKDIISRGGNKIAPAEIDLLLARHPDVAAALCCGVPDPRLGETVHAAVVLRDGACADAEDLRAWVAARTERFKVPDAIHIVAALPVGPTGKALRAGVALLAAVGAP
ncbi:class I adenylate-forming enzyme family protein [Roseixanthobacter glucoisosaccharinicivorans]|uniref:class I adenylate-forming enzyme family protein n=1 Tax=Roseixanthobacter glucoisosaccharinicivorans TaxID=3119923 RepID=UPI00372C2CAB